MTASLQQALKVNTDLCSLIKDQHMPKIQEFIKLLSQPTPAKSKSYSPSKLLGLAAKPKVVNESDIDASTTTMMGKSGIFKIKNVNEGI